jgi:ribose 5-phosphate isomerase B
VPPTDSEVREIVRKVLARLSAEAQAPDATRQRAAAVIGEREIQSIPPGGALEVGPDAVVTPLARQLARERRVSLEERVQEVAPNPSGGSRPRVSLGADHGGYALKEQLKPHLASLGYEVVDCGASSPDPVDYPDIAYAVARLVAEGRCANGIVIDGAGIGSCMVANKVPGVRAAMCYDHASAVNSREHNHANVLTLGAGMIGASLAKQIVTAWLATPYGGDRHARRVDKIMAIEQRHAR